MTTSVPHGARPGGAQADRGQALVEFCLVLPLLLLLLSIAVDVTRFLHIRQVAEEVVTDAAMYATTKSPSTGLYPTAAEVESRVAALFPRALGLYALDARLDTTVEGTSAVSIRLTCEATLFSPVLNGTLANSLTIQAAAWQPKR